MAVAMLTGRCWRELTARVPGFRPVPESHVIMIGTRDVDPLLDVLDTSEGRANGFAAPGGLSRSALLTAIGDIQMHGGIGAAALTAYDPLFDVTGSVASIAPDIAALLVSGSLQKDQRGGAA